MKIGSDIHENIKVNKIENINPVENKANREVLYVGFSKLNELLNPKK